MSETLIVLAIVFGALYIIQLCAVFGVLIEGAGRVYYRRGFKSRQQFLLHLIPFMWLMLFILFLIKGLRSFFRFIIKSICELDEK